MISFATDNPVYLTASGALSMMMSQACGKWPGRLARQQYEQCYAGSAMLQLIREQLAQEDSPPPRSAEMKNAELHASGLLCAIYRRSTG